jgi:PKD repeat protein
MTVLMMLACQLQPDGQQDVASRQTLHHPLSVASPLSPSLRPSSLDRPPADAPRIPPDTGEVVARDTAAVADTAAPEVAPPDTGLEVEPEVPAPEDTAPPPPPPPLIVARVTADVVEGDFPLVVSFDASTSDLGPGTVSYEWDFDDGEVSTAAGSVVHTYVGDGSFDASLTIVDDATGEASVVELEIEVTTPDCPNELPYVELGDLDDGGLDAVSGLVASRVDPDVLWVHEDRNTDELVALDSTGATLSEHELPERLDDFEDLAAALDPETGAPMLFLGDIGDNDLDRSEIAVWVLEEPDPYVDGDIDPLELELTYPDGPHNAETLLVDPVTFDLFIVTKDPGVDASVYAKRAPHDEEGPFELEALGSWSSLDLTATGGDVSTDGYRIVIRDYSTTARMWTRDRYLPFEEAFDRDPCRITINNDSQGEAIGFTSDDAGVVTLSEGSGVSMYFIEL